MRHSRMPQDERRQGEATSDTCPIDRRSLLLGSAATVVGAAIPETPTNPLTERELPWRNFTCTYTPGQRVSGKGLLDWYRENGTIPE